MIEIKFLGRTPTPSEARVGMETDSDAEVLVFDLPTVTNEQTAQLMLLLPDGEPETLLLNHNMILLPASALAVTGRIRGWVEILGGNNVVWNSEPFVLNVGNLPAVEKQIGQRYPTALQNAMDASVESVRYHDKTKTAAELVLAGSELWSIYVSGTKLIIDHALPTNAYEIAVRNGYTGTQAQWDALIDEVADYVSATEAKAAADAAQDDVDDLEDTVSDLSSTVDTLSDTVSSATETAAEAKETADAAQEDADAAQEAADAAQDAADAAQDTADSKAEVTKASLTVAAGDWGNSAPYTATVSCSIATATNNLIVGPGAVTAEQAEEFASCGIFCSGQGSGTITLKAIYKKPSVSLPVSVMGVN